MEEVTNNTSPEDLRLRAGGGQLPAVVSRDFPAFKR